MNRVLLCCLLCAPCGATEPKMQVRALPAGQTTIDVVTHTFGSRPALFCNLHDDENTSVEAAMEVLKHAPGRLVQLKHTGERIIAVTVDDQIYRFDPNRIFTAAGVRKTLEDQSSWNPAAQQAVFGFGQALIDLYGLNPQSPTPIQVVVALHNNSEARYAASSYAKGQEYEQEASRVFLNPESDPDDFFFVTDPRLFEAIQDRGFNVVLQNNAAATDDGSLSVYCGQHEIPYVNVEAQHGHLETQIAMIEALVEVLESLEMLPPAQNLINLRTLDPTFVIDAPYATPDNITKAPLYPENELYLMRDAAQALVRVQAALRKEGLGLKIYDAYRPLSVQKKLWAKLPDPRYVADPARGSRHNRGCAVDVTLVDQEGNELPMPTAFDEFTEKAHLDYMDLPAAVIRNREKLQSAMKAEGFEPLATEWWHFDAPGWQHHPVLDLNPYKKELP